MSSFTAPEQLVQPIDYQQIDNAVFDWVVSRLPEIDSRIIWQNQDVEQPEYPYVDLLRTNETEEGGIPETRNNTLDANGDVILPGGVETPVENEQAAYEPTVFTLTIGAFTDERNGANDPNLNAMKLLSKLKASLGLRTVIDAFSSAGVSIVRPLLLIDTSEISNSDWVSRGTLDILLRTASVMTERVEFYDKVALESTALNVDTVVDAS